MNHKHRLTVDKTDYDLFMEVCRSFNTAPSYLFSCMVQVLVVSDIEFFIKCLRVRCNSEPIGAVLTAQLSVLKSLISELELTLGGFD